jgi:hypothetical protein
LTSDNDDDDANGNGNSPATAAGWLLLSLLLPAADDEPAAGCWTTDDVGEDGVDERAPSRPWPSCW